MENTITMEEIVALAAKVAHEETLKAVASEKARQKRERLEMKTHNTRFLLKNYRLFRQHSILEEKKNIDKNTTDVLDILWSTNTTEEIKVESITQSVIYTVAIVSHIDRMLDVFKCMSVNTEKEDDERHYRVLMAMYIDEVGMSAEQIAEQECIALRTVYRDLNVAIDTVSSLIFGIDFSTTTIS